MNILKFKDIKKYIIIFVMRGHDAIKPSANCLFTSLEGDDCLAELFDHVNPPPFYPHHCIFVQMI